MNRFAKIHLWSAIYCGVLISLNWFWKTDYARAVGVTSEATELVGGAFLISVAVVVSLGWRVWNLVRAHLEQGDKVCAGRWIESWSVIIYALPLLWHQVSTSSWRAPDGVLATSTSGFGNALSPTIFLLAIAGLVLAQIKNRLSAR